MGKSLANLNIFWIVVLIVYLCFRVVQMTTQTSARNTTTPGASGGPINDDYLSVKVMRMKKPTFKSIVPVTVEDCDELGGIEEANKVFYPSTNYKGLGFSEYLMLPDEFGKIFVGEELRLYINLHNQSKIKLKNIILKIDLVKGKERKMLLDMSRDPINILGPESCHETLVSQPLYEIGMHIIVCNVHYKYGDGNTAHKKMVRKIFKFNSELPLKMVDLKIRELGRTENYVQMDLRNLTETALHVLVRFVPSKHVAKVLDHSQDPSGRLRKTSLNVDETRRYLFEVHQKPGSLKRNLGKIEFQWKTNFGERGLLTTSGIDKMLRPPPPIEVTITNYPSHNVVVEEVFEVNLEVKNNQKKDVLVDMLCDVENMFPIIVNGKSLQYIGTIKAGKTVDHKIQLLSLKAGMQTVGGGGLKVRDISNNQLYPLSIINIHFSYINQMKKIIKKKKMKIKEIVKEKEVVKKLIEME